MNMRRAGIVLLVVSAWSLGAADDDAQKAKADLVLKKLETRFREPLRQLYRSELHFMRMVCQPTKQQYERILAEIPTEKATVTKLLGMVQVGKKKGPEIVATQPMSIDDFRKLITDQIAKSLRPTLSAEQAGRYRQELEQRAQARKRVALLNLLAKFDKALALTAEQRSQLGEMLEKNWNDSWNRTQWFTNDFFPPVPDDKILPLLSSTQKAVWRDTPKQNIRFGLNVGIFEDIKIGEEVWSDEVPTKK